jgi:NADPH:quinone reductase-like Zn-dependent oxidoreductase
VFGHDIAMARFEHPRLQSFSYVLAAAAIAKNHGVHVISTTRNAQRVDLLRGSGADEVIIDDGAVAPIAREKHPEGVDKVLELIGTITLHDSLRSVKQGGIVCITGVVGNQWTLREFSPMEAIPSAVFLTSYAGSAEDFMRTPLENLAEQVASGKLKIKPGKLLQLDEIVEAHRIMEENKAGGKIVILGA